MMLHGLIRMEDHFTYWHVLIRKDLNVGNFKLRGNKSTSYRSSKLNKILKGLHADYLGIY